VETIRKIRLAARDGKKSIRQIAKDFNVSRNTVRKVLRGDQTRFEYHRKSVHRPKLGPFVDTLISLLENEQPLPLKQRRTAQGLYEAIAGRRLSRRLRQRASFREGLASRAPGSASRCVHPAGIRSW